MDKIIRTVVNIDGFDMKKFGHIELALTESELLKYFNFGDIVNVIIEGYGSYQMPFCKYYNEVGKGKLVLCTYTKLKTAVVAKNYCSLGVETGLLENDNNGENYHLKLDGDRKINVSISLKERAKRHKIFFNENSKGIIINKKVDENDDANIRTVSSKTIQDGILYRSSSPFDTYFNKNKIVDNFAREKRIKSIIDLADIKEDVMGLNSFDNLYCSHCKIAFLNMPLDVESISFKTALKSGLEFIATGESPFLICCREGRDRTGIFVAILHCLLGTEYDDIVKDYLKSFLMIHKKISNSYLNTVKETLNEIIKSILGIDKMEKKDLQKQAIEWAYSIGIEKSTLVNFFAKMRGKDEGSNF